MKKMKLFLVLVLALLMVPFGVYADEGDKKEVNVYFFKGEGCGFCAAGLEWFDKLDDKYDDMYELHEYETWYDEKYKFYNALPYHQIWENPNSKTTF